jgi:hypothetical protein
MTEITNTEWANGYHGGATLLVTCSDESHEAKIVKVATFAEMLDDETGERVGIESFRVDTSRNGWEVSAPGHTSLGVTVILGWPRTFKGAYVSSHDELICELCGFGFRANRSRLDPILQRLIDGGVTEIELWRLRRLYS